MADDIQNNGNHRITNWEIWKELSDLNKKVAVLSDRQSGRDKELNYFVNKQEACEKRILDLEQGSRDSKRDIKDLQSKNEEEKTGGEVEKSNDFEHKLMVRGAIFLTLFGLLGNYIVGPIGHAIAKAIGGQ